MATDNNINNFTAADIEKYHKGLLSAKEMHELEKAAMDDPFLADALEGYAVAGVNVAADIAELKGRLAQKTASAKVIPLQTTERKNNFRLLKVAAMLLFVAGATFAVYQFGFNKKAESIAQNEPAKATENKLTDAADSNTANKPVSVTEKGTTSETVEQPLTTDQTSNTSGSGAVEKKEVSISMDDEKAVPPAPVVATPTIKNNEPQRAIGNVTEKKILGKEEVKPGSEAGKQEIDVVTTKDKAAEKEDNFESRKRAVAATKKIDDQNYRNQTTNIFRGRVTDQNNVGVPFANVTNLEENTGTYTDVRGYFNLSYPDSIVDVQVRSIGFENNNIQLRNAAPTNQVVLQDDRSRMSEVVISQQKPNLQARSNNNSMQLEEPEPSDGWAYYDNYLVNNIQLPDDYKSKSVKTGEVQVSFEVNKNGEPVNFKIVKSLCSKCDKEAIRLIKEGPKWIRKAKNSRTTVTIPF
ncbi:MAG: carboxypeptidase-like regulatory domain-containing protein [Chitinophagaceae bacterium]|nr:carboxypeptidase-like regulatory domain-containing protein [Chitinophagaceae bacterium]MBP7109437.1 carboxypeptidase-like regulatory domain-containing protein [Chitinophagaceae bacterium]HQZ50697.1 carboxypeptidase-like regulatory domain-containing protein [Chitinophagaceae bacterium]